MDPIQRQSPPLPAFIFDLDGVLVDTAHYHFLAWNRLAKELGFSFTPMENEHLKGVSRMRALDILLKIGGIAASIEEKAKRWLLPAFVLSEISSQLYKHSQF